MNELMEKRDSWMAGAVKVHNLKISTTTMVEYIASYCLLEDLWFEVATWNFERATPIVVSQIM